MVLATIHNKNAAGAIIRLINMGIEPFLLASALKFVSAQRLARVNYPSCKKIYDAPDELLNFLNTDKNVKFFNSERCNECNGKEVLGR